MYCNQCHNARALGERPFANYQNVAAHMRVRANFTGEEYEKLMDSCAAGTMSRSPRRRSNRRPSG